MLHARHLGKRWVDRDGDTWEAHPEHPGQWQVLHVGYPRGRADGVPQESYGPYREVCDG